MKHPKTASSLPRSNRQKDKEITRLRRETAALRQKNAALERELADLRRRLAAAPDSPKKSLRALRRSKEGTREDRMLGSMGLRARHFRKASFFRYLWESIMDSSPVRMLERLVSYLRRIRILQMVLTILMATGAAILVAVLSAAVLPFLFFGTGVLSVVALLRSRRMNRLMRRALPGRPLRVLIPPRGKALEENSFFIRNARAMAADGVTVIVVTPYFTSTRGLGGKGAFFTARQEGEGLYVVRRHYYFFLRRHVLDRLEEPITLIY